MTITPLQLVSITDFILAAICLLISGALYGKSNPFSISNRSSNLVLFIFFVGMAAFMGGLDHGFFQVIDQRYIPTTLTYLSIAFATYFLFRYTIQQFFEGNLAKVLAVIALIQLILFVGCSFIIHQFTLVIANYSPILILFTVLNILHLKSKKGNVYFVITCITIVIATLVQFLGFQISPLLNEDTLYHLIAIAGYIVFYFGVLEKIILEQKINS
ncbi:MAG: hypothetical protein CFE21_07615 [Bacteroidetes bacterium B1(2017)]|nr:MAG: hypothetical protein CFE21_07615 [Bacteroidetes bacterium B1(2017)]